MSSTDLVLLVVAIATAAVLLSPPLLRSRDWRATVTPLASIIGSGFLVAGPILGHVAGHYAVAAMAALCAISYLFGLAVRDNISRLEPMLAAESPPAVLLWLDRAADLALILAYFVSVAYYLDLLADFALKAFDVVDPMVAHGMTTAILALLGTLGYFGGLRWLEHVELGSVGLKLAMIAALIAALAWALGSEVAAGTVAVRPLADQAEGFDAVRILLGLIILVQGFETSRYLGDSYDRATRVRTMRHAQWIAFVVYMLFIGLLTPWLDGRLPPEAATPMSSNCCAPSAAWSRRRSSSPRCCHSFRRRSPISTAPAASSPAPRASESPSLSAMSSQHQPRSRWCGRATSSPSSPGRPKPSFSIMASSRRPHSSSNGSTPPRPAGAASPCTAAPSPSRSPC
ncbi:hypothetical protein [Sphingopyxis sp. MC1]|uniref:hypothetical protein n=1 Tax=Sphingopyxis sp. MC1 TaxID=1174684 RepID=UPI0002D18224|nr:hypothetical protein [Sphingopyxis sp. MC1]ENY81982.1 hypothetical protein EBMC1_03814 [Sphingopyxis sp. MC1]